jgi:hypothetical protein
MAAFSLWQLLNQRQPIGNNDDSDPAQQQQAAGQAIGQSLIDLWNRADADATGTGMDDDSNPYLDHLIDHPPPPGTPPIRPQLLQYRPSDGFGLRFTPLEIPLAAGNPAPDPSDPRPDGTQGQFGDSNIRLAQYQQALPYVLGGAAAAAAAAAEWSRQQTDRLWKRAPPAPTNIDPAVAPESQPPASPDTGTPSPTSPDTPAPATSAMPGLAMAPAQPPDPIDSILWQRNHPMYDPASLPDYVAGDFSRGLHKAITDYEIDSFRKKGCLVEPNIRFGVAPWSPNAIADYVKRCQSDLGPIVHDVKTGDSGSLTKNQRKVYPAIVAGNAYSPSPGIGTFGFPMYQTLPPMPVELPSQDSQGWRTIPLR